MIFATHILGVNILHLFNTTLLLFIFKILPQSLYITSTHAIPVELTDTDSSFPSDDPSITNLMVSHYDCGKQHKRPSLT